MGRRREVALENPSLSSQLGHENPIPQMLIKSSVPGPGKLVLGPHEAAGEAQGTCACLEQTLPG